MLKEYLKKLINKILLYKSEFIWAKHIRRIHNYLNVNNNHVNSENLKLHLNYWSQLKKNVNPRWYEVYSSISGNNDIHFIPENIYFNIIEEKLNNRKLASAYGDKNFYEIFYNEKEIFPETILRNIDGILYDKNYDILNLDDVSFEILLNNYTKFLIKPSTESGGGKNIQLFEKVKNKFKSSENDILSLAYLKNSFSNNFIIQNFIRQNEFFAKFNDSSLNSLRVFTYRSVVSNKVIPLHVVLRIGKKGNFLDDQNVGGVAIKIFDDGKFNHYATDINGYKHYEYNGITFDKFKNVPKIQEIKGIAVRLAEKNIHSKLLGFDFTIDINDKIKLIEINHLWTGINFFQMNGSPILGEYTNEVMEFCKSN